MKNLIIKLVSGVFLMAFPLVVQAADADTEEGGSILDSLSIGDFLLFGTGAVVFIAAGWTMYRFTMLMMREKEIELYKAQGLEMPPVVEVEKGPSLMSRIYSRLTDAVPIDQEKDILMDHNYDGIRELDNNLPPWWLYGFYLSIVVAIFYIGYYHFSENAKSSAELYAIEMQQATAQVNAYRARQADQVDENNLEMLTDEADLADGKAVFTTNCIACHLDSGGGSPISVGPNLTDKYWVHGGGIKNVYSTIKYGVPEKGMIAWKAQLSPSDMHKVASYILTLQGTNPPNAKKPEGELWEETTGE